MLLEGVRGNERFKVLVPRRGVYQYIKAYQIAQHQLNAFLHGERLLHRVYPDKLWQLLREIKALQQLHELLVEVQTEVHYRAHQLVAAQLQEPAVHRLLQFEQQHILYPVREVAVPVKR